VTSLEFRNDVITYCAYRLRKRYNNILSNNFRRLKRVVVMFAKQHQRRKEKIILQRSPPQLINVATLPCKMKRSPSHYTTTPKGTKFHQKNKKVC